MTRWLAAGHAATLPREVKLDVGGRRTFVCRVARSAAEQARGLQGLEGLPSDSGLYFPFTPARSATFHMGEVSFPIDIVFLDGEGRVARLVEAHPGSRDNWAWPYTCGVFEVNAGQCRRAGVRVGDTVRVAIPNTHDLARGITTAETEEDRHASPGDVGAEPLGPGYYHQRPSNPGGDKPGGNPPADYAYVGTNPTDRWKDHNVGYSPDKMDGEVRTNILYPPTRGPDQALGTGSIERTDLHKFSVRNGGRAAQRIFDHGAFVSALLQGMATAGPSWKQDVLNGGATSSLAITPTQVADWMARAGASNQAARDAASAMRTPEAMNDIADIIVALGLADQAKVAGNIIKLFKGNTR